MDRDELKTALRNVRALRIEMERKRRQAEELEERASSLGRSIYKISKGSSKHEAPQELICEAIDIRKSIMADWNTLDDALLILEPEVEEISDLDIRWMLNRVYIHGDSHEDAAQLYEKDGLQTVIDAERRFFERA